MNGRDYTVSGPDTRISSLSQTGIVDTGARSLSWRGDSGQCDSVVRSKCRDPSPGVLQYTLDTDRLKTDHTLTPNP